jgi:hypothetical protein
MAMSSPPGTVAGPVPLARVALLAVGFVVLASTALHAALAVASSSPWIIPDELIYSELGRSLGAQGLPKIRDELSYSVVGLGYPALLAPVWALFTDAGTGYAAAKVANAFVLSLAAVPSYFLARRFVAERGALLVALLAVAVPSMLYAGTLMTEVALYPAFVAALLAIALALERPGRGQQLAALGAIVLCCAIKMLAIVLIPAYVVAIASFHWLDTRRRDEWRARMRAYLATWLALFGIFVVFAGLLIATGLRPVDALGAYSVVANNIDFVTTPWWALLHLAELDLYLAIVPFALTGVIAMRGARRLADRREKLFLSVVGPVTLALVTAVSAFASTPSPGGTEYPENVSRLHERSTFVLAPLFFIGLAMWLGDRRRGQLAAALVCAALLPTVIPLADFDANVRFQAMALVPWVELRNAVAWPVGGLLFTFTLAGAFALAVRGRAPTGFVVAPILFVFIAITVAAHVSMREASVGARSAMGGAVPDWVDRAVGPGADVSVLWAERPGRPFVELRRRHYVLFVGEFFNRSMGRVYELGSPMPYNLPTTPVRLEGGRVVLEDGSAARLGELVLAPCWVNVEGARIARDTVTGATVYRVPGQVRARVSSPETCS